MRVTLILRDYFSSYRALSPHARIDTQADSISTVLNNGENWASSRRNNSMLSRLVRTAKILQDAKPRTSGATATHTPYIFCILYIYSRGGFQILIRIRINCATSRTLASSVPRITGLEGRAAGNKKGGRSPLFHMVKINQPDALKRRPKTAPQNGAPERPCSSLSRGPHWPRPPAPPARRQGGRWAPGRASRTHS